jgi:hypothetical protein
MALPLLALLLLALVPTIGAAQQTLVYVDAAAGDDVNGSGSAQSPYRTLTRAIGRAATLADPIVRLRAGTYDRAHGEAFPLQLPARCTVEGDPTTRAGDSLAVKLVSDFGVGATFTLGGPGRHDVTLRGLRLAGGQYHGVQAATSGGSLALTITGCEVTHSRAVAVLAQAGATVRVALSDCQLDGVDAPLVLQSMAASTLDASLDRCRLRNGLNAGIVAESTGPSTLTLAVVNTWLHLQHKNGIAAFSNSGGQITASLEHVLFHDIGNRSVGGKPGAVLDVLGPSGNQPRWTIANTIFYQCKADTPVWLVPAYTFRTNLVQQADLIGLGGNLVGSPIFEDDSRERYRPRLGSPVIDRGSASAVIADLDGKPRGDRWGTPDIGPYEFHVCATWVEQTVHADGSATIHHGAHGPPSSAAVMFVAGARRPLPWFNTVHLDGPILPLFAANCDSLGLLSFRWTLPAQLVPVGTEVWFQPWFVRQPNLGPNAARLVVRAR